MSVAIGADRASWDVTYTITVTNPSVQVPITYSLSDTPNFPSGVTINTATATLDGSTPVGSWNGTSLVGMATNKVLAGGGVDVYTVVVNATAPPTLTGDPTYCTEGPGGGFYNPATATVGRSGRSPPRTACRSRTGR